MLLFLFHQNSKSAKFKHFLKHDEESKEKAAERRPMPSQSSSPFSVLTQNPSQDLGISCNV